MNSLYGYILGVDLEYPDELHNDYSLATAKLEINHDILPKYCSDIKIGGVNKLALNLGRKSKYVFHYKNLQLYLSLGMKLVSSLHRILKFKQSDWLEKYLDFNTDKRKKCCQ